MKLFDLPPLLNAVVVSLSRVGEKRKSLDCIKQAAQTLLQQSCVIEMSSWSAGCQDREGEYDALIENEHYYFFETCDGSSNFVLKIRREVRVSISPKD